MDRQHIGSRYREITYDSIITFEKAFKAKNHEKLII